MKATELIKMLQAKVQEYGDQEVMISQSDNCGGEVWTTDISVTTYSDKKDGTNVIIIEEVY